MVQELQEELRMYTTRIPNSYFLVGMIRKPFPAGFIRKLRLMSPKALYLKRSSDNTGPVEDLIIEKLQTLDPIKLIIKNDSHKHSHHQPMQNATNVKESHFKIQIVSDEFMNKSLPARHRMVYSLLSEEFNEKGLHALQMTTRTTDEDEAREKKEKALV